MSLENTLFELLHRPELRTRAKIQEGKSVAMIINKAIAIDFKKAEEEGGFSPDQLRVLDKLQTNTVSLVADIIELL